MSRPAASAKRIASLAAASAVADRKLFASFAAWAIPAGHQPVGTGR